MYNIRSHFNELILTWSAYYRRFDISLKIQRRQMRKYHEDAYDVNAYFMLERLF